MNLFAGGEFEMGYVDVGLLEARTHILNAVATGAEAVMPSGIDPICASRHKSVGMKISDLANFS